MNSKSALLNFSGLYGEKSIIDLPDFIHIEALTTRSRTFDWEISEHLHTNLFQIFILEKGTGVLVSEKRKIRLSSPCVVTVPANSLHGFSFEPGIAGNVITLIDSYLDRILKNHPDVLYSMQRLNVDFLGDKSRELIELKFLSSKLENELNGQEAQKLAVQPILLLLCISIYQLKLKKDFDKITSNNPSIRIYNDFQKLIRSTIGEVKSVNYYATELGITTVHLNRVCQQVSSKTAIRNIHDRLIDEAKRYLLNTEYNISEVAYFLNFKDPAHFTKLFKKYVGVTPSEFKKY